MLRVIETRGWKEMYGRECREAREDLESLRELNYVLVRRMARSQKGI